MSKALDAAKLTFKGIKNGASKFTASVIEGARIVPSKSRDHSVPLRIDAGKYDPVTKMLNVVLQVNSQAKSKGLQAWLKKFTTHGKLATTKFNTAAPDPEEEYHRMLDELNEKAKKNLKEMKTADDEDE